MAYKSIVGGKLIVTAKEGINHYAKEDIIINSNKTINLKGEEKGVSYGEPEVFKNDSENFDVSLSINKRQSTFVPLGILDFENNYENRFFVFDYSLKMTNLDSLDFQVFNDKGEQIYQMSHFAPIVVVAQRTPKLFSKLKAETPPFDPLKPIKTFDIQKLIDDYLYPDLTHIGNYCIFWDGFNNDEIYDSTWFDGKKLKAKITAKKGGTTKVQEVEFETTRKEVDWVDVKINKKTKRIDVTLRVDLKDGGANGLDCKQILKGMRDNTHWITECPWDDIPSTAILPNKPIIKQRTRSFADLEKLALDGIKKHWSRNSNYNVSINGEKYEIFLSPINTQEKSMNQLDLIFNSNSSWGRSGNPGVLGKIYYNVGYCDVSNWYSISSKWRYFDTISDKVDNDFEYTSAHELGHTILRKYGGKIYSFTHDDSSTILQNPTGNQSYIKQKNNSEINLMHYFKDDPSQSQYDYNLIVASERDSLSLIWLTKINIKG